MHACGVCLQNHHCSTYTKKNITQKKSQFINRPKDNNNNKLTFHLYTKKMFTLFDWICSALSSLGLYQKKAKIIFLGLDNAGKTTLLMMLKEGRVKVHEPTLHPSLDEIRIGNIHFKTYDLGGHETARRLWEDYFPIVDGIVFVVDALDRSRFVEAKKELHGLLTTQSLENIPILILGNKIDNPTAASEEELYYSLGLHETTTTATKLYGKDNTTGYNKQQEERPIEIFMCSVIRRVGYSDGFRWLSQFL